MLYENNSFEKKIYELRSFARRASSLMTAGKENAHRIATPHSGTERPLCAPMMNKT
jgi:hypothetical protein